MGCEHKWKKELDYEECEKCHWTKRTINFVNYCYDELGNRVTYVPDLDEGEQALEEVENELKALKEERRNNKC